jgi:hypothetical protein
MPYEIEWEPHGAIKYYSGVVLGHDLLESEREIASSPDFTSLRFVVSVYLGAERVAASAEERQYFRAIRIGSHTSNPRLKFAVVTTDSAIRRDIESSVEAGEVLHRLVVFDTFAAAIDWATSPY